MGNKPRVSSARVGQRFGARAEVVRRPGLIHEHRPAREARAAHKAYSSAAKAIAANPKDIKVILHKFITFFNTMDGISTWSGKTFAKYS